MRRILVYQTFCGRAESANVRDHQGSVFANLSTRQWSELKDSGFDIVYLLGVWNNRGPIVVNEEAGTDLTYQPDRYPSPFAVIDHTKPNPDLGSVADFKLLIESVQRTGLRVIVDFIPNHTSIAHPWVSSHPDYYKSTSAAFSGDVFELDYTHPEVVREMTSVMEALLNLGVDGFRVDMAHLIPPAFWKSSLAYLKRDFPDALFLAEAYSSSVFDLSVQENLQSAGFDAVYDEPLFRNLKTFPDRIDLTCLLAHYEYIRQHRSAGSWCHYLENHDDSFPLPMTFANPLQALILALPGWHFIYEGFLQGKTNRIAHHWVDILQSSYADLSHVDPQLRQFMSWLKATKPDILKVDSQDAEVTVSFSDPDHHRLEINLSADQPNWKLVRSD